MKSIAAISLLVLLVTTHTPIGQFLKLPFLLEHFVKHRKHNGVTLIDFLKDHYTTNHNDADLPEDEQLPFKDLTVYNLGYAIVPGETRDDVIISLPEDKKIGFPGRYVLQQHLFSIFHPPRL